MLLLFYIWSLLLSQAAACDSGWFGLGCMYKCHCSGDQCPNADGQCSKCVPRWFGPACQYADLLQESQRTPVIQKLADNNDNTCLDRNTKEVNVSWKTPYPFSWMRIVVQNPDVLSSFNVSFNNSITPVLCTNVRTSTVTDRTIDIYCDLPGPVIQMTLTGSVVSSLCSLYISGGRNVALLQNATQSSTWSSNKAEKAVDGNNNPYFNNNSCTATISQTNPSWSVKFRLPSIVNRYVLYNRDNIQYRLHRFALKSFDVGNVLVYNYTDTSEKPQGVYTITTQPVSVSGVTIQLNVVDVLTLCEAEIYGDTDCTAGKYGRNCDQRCNCANSSVPCFVSTGGCPSGCAAGYHGEDCKQPCENGTYGIDCKLNCSQFCIAGNIGTAACDNKSGACLKGCQDGYMPSLCDKICSPGTFGKGCQLTCPQFCKTDASGTPVCDHVNGTCLNGCQDGYLTSMCNLNCPIGKFGQNCNFSCSPFCVANKQNIAECNHATGKCECQYGYETAWCNKSCDAGKYGQRCGSTCSKNCLVVNSTYCSHINGTCLQGCQTGYTDHFCDKFISENGGNDSDVPVGIIVGVILGLVAAAVIVAVIVTIIWRRRKTKSSQNNNNSFNSMNNGSTAALNEPEMPKREKSQKVSNSRDKENIEAAKDVAATGIYYNDVPEVSPTVIQLKDLGMFLSSHSTPFYQEQFNVIPSNNEATTVVAERPENKIKNRYKNISAYDHSRVNLMSSDNHKQDDYINASHIQGYNGQESFIASQGPMKRTTGDFVRMIWEQNTEEIVMLTNLIEQGKLKCERYWPEDGEMKVGEITVQLTTTQVFADYTIRKLKLRKDGHPDHLVTHFHFTAWPDKDVPQTPWSLVDFEQRVASYPTSKPIVVHCSAGVGRTGAFIALRNVMKQAEDKGYLDIFSTVKKLRHDRINMVQTSTQYEFLHRAAQVAILCMGTTVTANDIQQRISYLDKTAQTGLTNMENEFKIICNLTSYDEGEKGNNETDDDSSNSYENRHNTKNKLKNRLSNIIPKMLYAPALQCETDYLEDYINAVFVPNFRKQNQQFLTQLPLPTTVLDFWRLVTQYNVSLIVSFEDDLKATDQTVGEYLPSSDNQAVTFSMFELETKTISTNKLWQQRKVTVTADTEYKNTKLSTSAAMKEEHILTHLKCLTTDLHPEKLLPLICQIRSLIPSGDGRTIYMCRNGADYSGLVCVLSLLLDRMDNDGCCTVPLVVGAIKAIRPQVIPTLVQYQRLYQVLHLYNDSSNVYANLDHKK